MSSKSTPRDARLQRLAVLIRAFAALLGAFAAAHVYGRGRGPAAAALAGLVALAVSWGLGELLLARYRRLLAAETPERKPRAAAPAPGPPTPLRPRPRRTVLRDGDS